MLNEKAIKEIKQELDVLTIIEFRKNYNKGEIERMLNNNENYLEKKAKEKIQEIFNRELGNEKDLSINITSSYMTILKKDKKIDNCFQIIDTIWSNMFFKIPYSYTMGKKVSKKVLNEFLTSIGLEAVK